MHKHHQAKVHGRGGDPCLPTNNVLTVEHIQDKLEFHSFYEVYLNWKKKRNYHRKM